MQATPSTAFKMSEPDLLLELKIVTLDAPPELGGVNEATKVDVCRQGREPIFCRLLLALGPFDQQPFFRPRLATIEVALGDANA